MKKITLILIAVFAFHLSLISQQNLNTLPKTENGLMHHSTVPLNLNPEQNQKTTMHNDLDFYMPTKSNLELNIRIDSVFIMAEQGYFREVYAYDANGNILTYLRQNWENSTWVNDWKRSYTYGVNGNMLTRLEQNWENSIWVNVLQVSYTYGLNGNMLTYLGQIWENNAWVNVLQVSYTYGLNGNMLTSLRQNWENNAWVNDYNNSYTYNTNGNILTYLRQNWENNAWVNHWKYSHTYDANGNMLTRLEQNWGNSTWVNSSQDSYTYDANGNKLTYLGQIWGNSTWVNFWKNSYTYDANGNLLTRLEQNWGNSIWVNNRKYIYTYDANGNMLTDLRQDWENNTWVKDWLCSYTYDTNGNMLTYLGQIWGNNAWVNSYKNEFMFISGKIDAMAYEWSGSNWIESSSNRSFDIMLEGEYIFEYSAISLEIYYTDVSSDVKEQDFYSDLPISCYPNPASDNINVNINLANQASSYLIELYNQSGQKVKSFERSPEHSSSTLQFSVEDIPSGLYMLHITTGQQSYSQKIIVAR